MTSDHQCDTEQVFHGVAGEHGKCVRVRVRGVGEVLQEMWPGKGWAGSLHLESNCEGCEFELLETLLDLGCLLLLRALPAALRASCTFAESCPVDSRHACLASAVHRTGCARLTCKGRWQVCLASRLAHRAHTQNTCIRGGGAAVVRGAAEAPGNT